MPGHARAVDKCIRKRKKPCLRCSSGSSASSLSLSGLFPLEPRMKRLIAEVIYQVLIELLSQILMRLADWLSALPWL